MFFFLFLFLFFSSSSPPPPFRPQTFCAGIGSPEDVGGGAGGAVQTKAPSSPSVASSASSYSSLSSSPPHATAGGGSKASVSNASPAAEAAPSPPAAPPLNPLKWAELSEVNVAAVDDAASYAEFAAWAAKLVQKLVQKVREHDWTGTWSRRKDCITPAYVASWVARGKTEADARAHLSRPYVQNWARPSQGELHADNLKPGVWNVTTFAYGGSGKAGSTTGAGADARKGGGGSGGTKGLFFRGRGRGVNRSRTSLPVPPQIIKETKPDEGGGGGDAPSEEHCTAKAVDSVGDSSAEAPSQGTAGFQVPPAASSSSKPMMRKELHPRRHLTYHIGDWTETYLGPSTLFGDSKRVVTLRRRTTWLPEPDADPGGEPLAPGLLGDSSPTPLPPPGLALALKARNDAGSGVAGGSVAAGVTAAILGYAQRAPYANSVQIAHSTQTYGPRGVEETRRFFKDGQMVVRRSFAPMGEPGGTLFVADELFRKNLERKHDGDDGDGSAGAAAALNGSDATNKE